MVHGDASDSGARAALHLEAHELVRVHPVLVVCFLKGAEAEEGEAVVVLLEQDEDARHEALELVRGEGRGGGVREPALGVEAGEEHVEGCCGLGVRGIDTAADYEVECARAKARRDQDSPNLDILGPASLLGVVVCGGVRVLGVDIVGPLQLHGHIRVAGSIGLDSFDDSHSSQVLYEYNWGLYAELHWMFEDSREGQAADRGDPGVAPAASASDLHSARGSQPVRQLLQQLVVLVKYGRGAGDDFAVEEERAELARGKPRFAAIGM